MTIPELLAPAGNPQKLKTALHFGADAVYLGLKRYSLRAGAGNFNEEQLRWALDYAHDRGRRVYVAVNLQPYDDDLDGVERTLARLGEIGPDAVIVADPAVVVLARRVAPDLELHLSTQASVTNAGAARFWHGQGIRRIIVARELSLERLARLVDSSKPCEIEAFAHGAVCIATSGRCLLSLYWAGEHRDPRRGSCAQGCRWRYRFIEDRRRPGEPNRVEQDDRGTYFFDAKDLCALPVLDRMADCGLAALKLEGRTRSVHYLGVTVDVYRQALDLLAAGDRAGFVERVPDGLAELRRAGYRGFSTHFLTGEENAPDSYLPRGSPRDGTPKYVGRIVDRTADGLVLLVQNRLRPKEALEIRDAGLRCETITPRNLVTEQGEAVDQAVTGNRILLPGSFHSGPEALVRHAPTGKPKISQ